MADKSKPYNGHKNWAHWNVALWIANDEPLYRLAKQCLKEAKSRKRAALAFIENVGRGSKTPDGAVYSVNAVYAALDDL